LVPRGSRLEDGQRLARDWFLDVGQHDAHALLRESHRHAEADYAPRRR
jgi:hypothetical protein